MNGRISGNFRAPIWLVLLFLLPFVMVFLLIGFGLSVAGGWFWLVILVSLSLLWLLFGAYLVAPLDVPEPELRMLYPPEHPDVIRDVMNVQLATEESGVQVFRGRLREPAEAAYNRLAEVLRPGVVPLLQEDERYGATIVLMPRSVEAVTLERPARPVLHWILFGLTVLTTTGAGAAHQGVDLLHEPWRLAIGLPYALALLTILGVHELGHYFAARRHGINVTPPFFIPVPFGLGTFGAFIQMRSPVENRRSLFDVAVAGPLAGLAVAIPALLIGLQTSTVLTETMIRNGQPSEPVVIGGASAGESLLLALLAKIAIPEALEHGSVIRFSALAFAGWLGIFITGLNLLPIGQLDGGHMARAMFGTRRGRTVATIALWSLILLGIYRWPGLLTWALIAYFLLGRVVPPLDDVTPVTPGRRWLGYLTLLILLLILVPLPRSLWPAVGIYCPYL